MATKKEILYEQDIAKIQRLADSMPDEKLIKELKKMMPNVKNIEKVSLAKLYLLLAAKVLRTIK